MIRAVLFDLDGTLLDRHSSLIVYVHQQMERHASLLGGIGSGEYIASVVELDAHGHRAKEDVFRQIERDFNLPSGSWESLFGDYTTYFPDICVPFPRMHQTLSRLHHEGFALGLVTNGAVASQFPKIDGLGIRKYFGTVLVSEAENVKKPDPEIFRRAVNALKVIPDETVFVGDNPESDIAAAKAIGMKTIWMRDSFWLEPENADAKITQLCEVPDVLNKMNADR